MNPHPDTQIPDEDEPPILGSWNRMYLFVLAAHAFLIAMMYLFTLLMR